ncbi:glycine cleavage system protein GcvH [Halocatena marina]|uniref:glycine cleavage system protein GcvH n=1 Tax=Halocatena marina TaxID=2934937 RepID=UPI00200E688A|nr:glycine cleavage system protein GcvH [Halocatena marina]
MSFDTPDDLRYLETHEWARIDTDDETARIGISEFAQDELGDIVFVEVPDTGETLTQQKEFGVVESIKAVSDLYAPLSGTVSAVNEELFDAPELVNDDPYGDGWMLELEDIDTDNIETLLTAKEYEEQIE